MRSCVVLTLAALLASPVVAAAAEQFELPPRTTIWDVGLGSRVDDIPKGFFDTACGTNGGPPSLPIGGFADFDQCPPDQTGLHEVYFRYDDMLEYWARANRISYMIRMYAGTKVLGFPVILSLLIADTGIVEGYRIVTDPRDKSRNREDAVSLGNFLIPRFDISRSRDCTQIAPSDGESDYYGRYINQICKGVSDRGAYELRMRLFRREGETTLDPHTGRVTEGQFLSETRFQILDPAYASPVQ